MNKEFDNAIYLKSLVGKDIKVTTINDDVYNGILYVIDPISKTVVLAVAESSKYKINVIPSDNIKCFEVTSTSVVNHEFLFGKAPVPLPNLKTLQEKKETVKEWLKINQINIEEEECILLLKDHKLTIEPPYEPEQCFCDNMVVLDRIQTLMRKMSAV